MCLHINILTGSEIMNKEHLGCFIFTLTYFVEQITTTNYYFP